MIKKLIIGRSMPLTLVAIVATPGCSRSADPSLIAASFIPFLLSIFIQIIFSAWAQGQIDFLADQHRLYYAVLENGISGIQDGINADVLRDQLMARIDHA